MSHPFKILHKRKRLFLSFSAGKTSAYMTKLLREQYAQHWDEVVVGFANSTQEHEKSLEYVRSCDEAYGFGTVWLEATINPQLGEGTGHRVISFETATRNGSVFESMIEKYGLPNNQYFHCTRELKLAPIRSYLRSIGWAANTYNTAIGIRHDEMDRMDVNAMEGGAFYPLIDLRVTKADVLAWDLTQPVRLGIPEHYGNCVWCWKKSFRKLATVATELPEAMRFPARCEVEHKDKGRGDGDRRFFRGRKTVPDIIAIAKEPGFQPYVDSHQYADEFLDTGMACGESCEIEVEGSNRSPSP